MNKQKVIIPFRARTKDGLVRGANLAVVQAWWWMWGFEPVLQTDGLDGDKPFNRHRAFNLAVERFSEDDVFLFAEADMLLHPAQAREALAQALASLGLVVPFREFHGLSEASTEAVRDTYEDNEPGVLVEWWGLDPIDPRSIFTMHPDVCLMDGEITGSVFAISRETYDRVGGFTEHTSGVWFDDAVTKKAIEALAGARTRWVPGTAVHLYHTPLWAPENPDKRDKDASAYNEYIYKTVRALIKKKDREGLLALTQFRLGATTQKEI